LKEFLLAEAMINEKDETQIKLPDNFEKIERRGSITSVAQEALGDSSLKGARIKAATAEGKKEIIEKLKVSSTDGTILGTMKTVLGAQNDLQKVFIKDSLKTLDDGDGVMFKVTSDWASLGGSSASSKKLMLFWIESTLMTYGAPHSKSDVIYAFSDVGSGQFLIQKK